MQVGTYVAKMIKSELSGNVIGMYYVLCTEHARCCSFKRCRVCPRHLGINTVTSCITHKIVQQETDR